MPELSLAGAIEKDFVGWGPYLIGMDTDMELRTCATSWPSPRRAASRLQPSAGCTQLASLSRQIRDLEYEVGLPLLTRSVRGVEMTAAGRAFLEHARLALAQVEAAKEAALRAARPTKPTFVLGFLTGY